MSSRWQKVLGLKEFGQADDLRTLARGLEYVRDGARQILLRFGRARHLHDANVKISFGQRSAPREKCVSRIASRAERRRSAGAIVTAR